MGNGLDCSFDSNVPKPLELYGFQYGFYLCIFLEGNAVPLLHDIL